MMSLLQGCPFPLHAQLPGSLGDVPIDSIPSGLAAIQAVSPAGWAQVRPSNRAFLPSTPTPQTEPPFRRARSVTFQPRRLQENLTCRYWMVTPSASTQTLLFASALEVLAPQKDDKVPGQVQPDTPSFAAPGDTEIRTKEINHGKGPTKPRIGG